MKMGLEKSRNTTGEGCWLNFKMFEGFKKSQLQSVQATWVYRHKFLGFFFIIHLFLIN